MSALRISSDPEKTIRELLLSDNSKDYFDLIPNRTLLLNFNYTQTDRFYQDYWTGKSRKAEIIHIHGSTAPEDKNPIIFGFGDELDDDYQNIEKLNDDRFLENIKSIDYLQTNNYKNLLEFIDGERYQIFICGHSCGLSDRTLLNTLFEHENCSSIRSFFYMPNESDDNFKQITCNISRNFNDKAKLRDRVVNKMYSEELVRRK